MPTDIIIEKLDEDIPLGKVHPDGFFPYVIDITEEMRHHARINLNETPELRAQCLQELRERLNQVPDLSSRTDDRYLLGVLRSRKFDIERSFSLIKRYYAFLESYRHIFCHDNLQAVQKFAESSIVTYLPYRDEQKRALLFIRTESWDPRSFPPEDLIYSGLVNSRTALEMPVNQIMGFVAIVDVKHLTLRQIFTLAPRYGLFAAHGLQYCCPSRISAAHVINMSEIQKIGWKLIKHLISEKLRERIMFHDDYESLHKQIPKAILPEELGGDLGPANNDHWLTDVGKMQANYYKDTTYGYKNWNKKSAKSKVSTTSIVSRQDLKALIPET